MATVTLSPGTPGPSGTSKRTPNTPATMNNSGAGATSPVSKILSFFVCPVCTDYAVPPIFQCGAGHLICSLCHPKHKRCPSCRDPLGNIRNLGMEGVANAVLFPCKFAALGCSLKLVHTDKIEHEVICDHRPYGCPRPGSSCEWQGTLDQVKTHLMIQHKKITTIQGEDVVLLAQSINLPGAVDWVMIQHCFEQDFMLVLNKQAHGNGQIFLAMVKFIGSRKKAEQFTYRLELECGKRRLLWEGTPSSIHESVEADLFNLDCLAFSSSIAQVFAENGNLNINSKIYMHNSG